MTNTNIGQNILNIKKVTTYSKDENGKTNYKNVKEYDDNENLIWEAKDEENDDIFEYQIHYGENGNTLEYFDNNSDGKADYITAMGKEMSILLEDADEDGTIDSAMRKFNYIEGTDKEEKKYTEEFYDKNGNLVLSLNDKNGDRLTDNFVFEGEKCDFFLADLTEGIYGIYQSFRRFFNIN